MSEKKLPCPFSIEELEPLEVFFDMEKKQQDPKMIEVQETISEYNKFSLLDSDSKDLYQLLSQGTSTNLQESKVNTQKAQSYDTQNSSEALKEQRINRAHLNRSRRRRQEQRSQLELQFSGYWTKNFLPIGKNPHFQWLLNKKDDTFFQENPKINEIKMKKGICMEDYLYLYRCEELKDTWREFFRTKFLYREVMLSRAQGKSKIVFMKFLRRFEEAFKTGVFDHIA